MSVDYQGGQAGLQHPSIHQQTLKGLVAPEEAEPGESFEETLAEQESAGPPPGIPLPEPPPARRATLPWILRVLLPLGVLLIPLLNYLFWDSPLRIGSRGSPVLEQALLCESVQQGQPMNSKTVFSIREDRQVVFYSRWSGVSGGNAYLLRWYRPDGNLYRTVALSHYRFGRTRYSTYTVLPLREGMPLGEWQVEVSTDEQTQARLSFALQE